MILLAFIVLVLWVTWHIYRLLAYRRRRSYEGKTVLIAGACSALGRRLCQRLHASGAHVVAWDSSKLQLEEVLAINNSDSSDASTTTSGRITTAMVDMGSRMQVKKAAQELLAAHSVDAVLSLCPPPPPPGKEAGAGGSSFAEQSEDMIEKVLETNTLGPLMMARLLCPPMARRPDGGQFVTFTAHESHLADGKAPDYAAAQWALVGMHHSLRAWLRGSRKQAAAAAVASKGSLGGEVRLTLVSLDAQYYAVPTAARASLGVRGGRAASPSPPPEGGDGAAGDALERVVDGVLWAIARGEERYHDDGWTACGGWLSAMALALPVPWGAALWRALQWRYSRAKAPKSKTS